MPGTSDTFLAKPSEAPRLIARHRCYLHLDGGLFCYPIVVTIITSAIPVENECCANQKSLYLCVAGFSGDIFLESVFLSLVRNLTVSTNQGRTNDTHSCLGNGIGAFLRRVPHIYSSVGYCYVYLIQGFVRTSY